MHIIPDFNKNRVFPHTDRTACIFKNWDVYYGSMSKETEFMVLAGGQGKRLKDITEQTIPKCEVQIQNGVRGIDIILSQLNGIGVNATFSSNNYFYKYQHLLENTDHHMLWQKPGGITQAVLQTRNRVLTIASDCIFPFEQLLKMVEIHRPGTITWAITKHRLPSMSEYEGCDVTNGNIVGRNDTSIIRSPTIIADFDILRSFVENPETDDLYCTVLRRAEEENLRRLTNGQTSILNAFFLNGPIIDYGTPQRLDEAANILERVLHPQK